VHPTPSRITKAMLADPPPPGEGQDVVRISARLSLSNSSESTRPLPAARVRPSCAINKSLEEKRAQEIPDARCTRSLACE